MVDDENVAAERANAARRRAMVDNQIRTFEVTDQQVLERFSVVPRERFLPDRLAALAYSDAPVTLKSSSPDIDDRVMPPPLFLARMVQGLTMKPGGNALVVAGATGYAAAILAGLSARVVTLDADPGFSAVALQALRDLEIVNVTVATGPLTEGYAAGAPYDGILINGAVECGLDTLFGQLAPDGCVVAIDTRASTASRRAGKAVRFDRVSGDVSARSLFDATVPVLPAFRDPPRFTF